MNNFIVNSVTKHLKKSKNKHNDSNHHQFSTKFVVSRYHITKPNFFDIPDKLKKYVSVFNNNFTFYLIIREQKLLFKDLTYTFIFRKMYIIDCHYYSRQYLITKLEYFATRGYNFSHISEMNVVFGTDHRIIT